MLAVNKMLMSDIKFKLFNFIGESVPEDERLDIKEEVSTPSSLLDKYVKSGNSGIFALESERTRLEEEKNKLYQQLDDKVCCFMYYLSFLQFFPQLKQGSWR